MQLRIVGEEFMAHWWDNGGGTNANSTQFVGLEANVKRDDKTRSKTRMVRYQKKGNNNNKEKYL